MRRGGLACQIGQIARGHRDERLGATVVTATTYAPASTISVTRRSRQSAAEISTLCKSSRIGPREPRSSRQPARAGPRPSSEPARPNPRYHAHDGSTTPASRSPAARPGPIFEPVSAQPPSWTDHRAPGERAAALAASWCTRRLGRSYAQPAWQMLADAARLGVVRHGRPEAWAAGAVIALARASGLLGAGRALAAQQVADELDVTLGALAVTERELARALNLAHYAHRPPSAWSPTPGARHTPATRSMR